MGFSSNARHWAFVQALAALAALASACRAAPPPAAHDDAARPVASVAIGPLPARADAVASADAWAIEGAKLGGPSGAARLLDAAALRQRVFRVEHREADALEAIELYRQAAEDDQAARCAALTSAATLEGELRADPSATYQAVYRAEHAPNADRACKERAAAILATLTAYRPLPTVLAGLLAEASAPVASESASASALASVPSSIASAQSDVIVPTVAAEARGPARVTKIERYGSPDAARVVVFVTAPSTYQVGFLDEGSKNPRLFVDIDAASYHGQKSFDVGGLVERVRVGAEPARTRVVLDLNGMAYRRVFYVPEPFRLIIDVSKEPPKHVEEAAHGPRAIHRVVLDPGHGGHDPGASGPSGLREKDVTLDIAHRAAPLIARELGIATLLTRDGDDYVALDERTARANAFQADLFVSIHCNASEDGAGRGVMTFVLDDSRDAVSMRVAARENDSSTEAAAELATAFRRSEGGGARSSHFAELLQRAAIASLAPSYGDIPDSGIKRAGFYVLAGARMPAVLFETSFISNPVGETRFNTGDFRQKIADAVVNAIRAYRDGL
ncbi:MAG TPA: N-acetylmuramoyl-L-alanine amidase [Polyangiaceae bacterium]|jgi:N-acetylmuramoyl-L-alanine amidase|nr:N-acetylmuramoyl-L-alanine amidase [Polyangiaceae bacterium]